MVPVTLSDRPIATPTLLLAVSILILVTPLPHPKTSSVLVLVLALDLPAVRAGRLLARRTHQAIRSATPAPALS